MSVESPPERCLDKRELRTPENDTSWHDHDISAGAVTVVGGTLKEFTPRIGGPHVEVEVSEGTSFWFGSEHIHRLVGSADRSVSIHAYSPPLWRLGQYSIDESGVMRRTSVSYADEFRPVDAAAWAIRPLLSGFLLLWLGDLSAR